MLSGPASTELMLDVSESEVLEKGLPEGNFSFFAGDMLKMRFAWGN